MRSIALALLLVFGCADDAPSPPTCESNCGTPEDPDGDGYVDDDCAPLDSAIHPGAVEVCDGLDNDCNGQIDDDATDATVWYADVDGDGYGAGQAATACVAPANTAALAGDCNDDNAAIHPDALETDCTDPVDYNCDGSVGFADADQDGSPACQDCNDNDANRSPLLVDACDGVDNNCDAIVDNGTTNEGAYLGTQLFASIQAAIDAAPDGGTVSICPGTYVAELSIAGKAITLTSHTGVAADVKLSSLEVVDVPLTLSKLTFEDATMLSAVHASNAPLVVDGCRFIGNQERAITTLVSATNKLSLRVLASEFIDNTDSDAASAIRVFSSRGGSQVTINGSTFINNATTGGSGHGAILMSSCGDACGSQTADALNIIDSTFEGNTATGKGGALSVVMAGAITITNSTFKLNSADLGGAISIFPLGILGPNQLKNGVVLAVTGSTFEGNTAPTGAAILFPSPNSYSQLELEQCVIAGNTADAGQAAIDARSQPGNLNGDLTFLSKDTTWGGVEGSDTNNVAADLLMNCGVMRDVTADVSCF